MGKQKKEGKPKYSTWQSIGYVTGKTWRQDKGLIGITAAFMICASLAPFTGILFPKLILEELMGGQRMAQLLMLLGGFFLSGAVLQFLVTYLKSVSLGRILSMRINVFIPGIFRKCLGTDFQNTESPAFLDELKTAERGLNGNTYGVEGMMHKLFDLAGIALAFLGYAAIIGSLSPWILLFLSGTVIVSYCLTYSVRRFEHSQKDGLSAADRRSDYFYRVMYDFNYGKELRLQCLWPWASQRFQQYRDQFMAIRQRIERRDFACGLADALMLVLREGVIYAYLIYLVLQGRLGIPSFTMYVATVAAFATWLTTVLQHLAFIRAQNLDVCDYRSFVERAEPLEERETLPLPPPPYSFSFQNVSFRYPGSQQYVYRNLSLEVPAGQKLAIVGHNGAGKTTFVKLLCRMYDVEEGAILLNGVDIRRFDKQEYFKLFSAVFQEVCPLAFPVAENIAVREGEEIDYNRVSQAIRDVGMEEKIQSLPNGVHTGMLRILDPEGVALSGGENQKIAMARALYKDAPIVILDEPTAALDALAENQVYRQLSHVAQGKTAIFISHRLASTQFCDVIAMIEQGELVEYGPHEQLLKKGGKYAEMFDTQAKYYRKEEAAS